MKTENTSLFRLGQEYERCAELQRDFIEKCRADLKRAKDLGDSNAVRRLEQELRTFREIRRELRDTARKLMTYYN